eukprot:4288016-Pyramimonas_sp.AAC.1
MSSASSSRAARLSTSTLRPGGFIGRCYLAAVALVTPRHSCASWRSSSAGPWTCSTARGS